MLAIGFSLLAAFLWTALASKRPKPEADQSLGTSDRLGEGTVPAAPTVPAAASSLPNQAGSPERARVDLHLPDASPPPLPKLAPVPTEDPAKEEAARIRAGMVQGIRSVGAWHGGDAGERQPGTRTKADE